MPDARRRERGSAGQWRRYEKHPILGECTEFRANIPYFEQMPEKPSQQAIQNQCIAWKKANRRSMDLVEFFRKQGTGNREQGIGRPAALGTVHISIVRQWGVIICKSRREICGRRGRN
jgi:hypothetical protein